MLYRPLSVSLMFLVFSLVYFFMGPVTYRVDNLGQFLSYFIFYILMGTLGYLSGVYFSSRVKVNRSTRLFRINFWSFFFFSLISSLIFNYVVASGNLIPLNIFNYFVLAFSGELLSLGDIYYENKINSVGDSSSFIASLMFAFLGWARFIVVPYLVWNWMSLTKIRKFSGIFVAILPVLTGLSIGLNKPIFDFSLIFLFSTLISYYIKRKENEIGEYRRLRRLLKNSLIAISLSVIIFGLAMNSRGVTFQYIEFSSPLRDIAVKEVVPENSVSISLVMLGHYMFQGYYAFSLSLDQDFDSTYGFGHSPFLARQFSRVFNRDLTALTYQQKIDKYWPNGLRWHSAFSQFANDFHFFGVGFVVYSIFFMIALSWVFSYKYGMREFIYFMPMHGILVVFLPANNQVFGFADSLGLVLIISLALFYRLVCSR